MGWPVVVAAGDPRRRGRAYGAQSANRVRRSIEMYRTIFRRYASLDLPDVRARARAFVPALDEFDPELLPEMEGIAEGAGVEPDDVLAINLRTEIMFGLNASGTSSGSR